MTWREWASVAASVLLFVVPSVIIVSRQVRTPQRRQQWLSIMGSVRLRHWPVAWLLVGVVLLLSTQLRKLPILKWGWMNLFLPEGGSVNGSAMHVAEGHGHYWVAAGLILLLGISMPVVVESEERSFRRGVEHQSWSTRIWRSFKFGMMHLTLGIPIAAALAIAVGGFGLTLAYLWSAARATGDECASDVGLRESTAIHLAFNFTLVIACFLLMVLLAVVDH